MAKRPDEFSSRGESVGLRWLGPLGRWIDRRLNAPAAADPLYLSNRTLAQKMKMWVLVGVPCLVMAAFVYYGLTSRADSEALSASASVTPVQASARAASDHGTVQLQSNQDLEILDAHIVHGATTTVEGSIRNNTARHVSAEVVFNLTDARGSQVGALTARMDLAPHARATFKLPIQQPQAAFALVDEMHAR